MPAAPGMRRLFLSVIAASTAGVLPVFLLGGLAVQVREDLGFSTAAQGWVVFGYFGVSAASSAAFGHLVERVGPARGMRVAAGVIAVGGRLIGAGATARAEVVAAG